MSTSVIWPEGSRQPGQPAPGTGSVGHSGTPYSPGEKAESVPILKRPCQLCTGVMWRTPAHHELDGVMLRNEPGSQPECWAPVLPLWLWGQPVPSLHAEVSHFPSGPCSVLSSARASTQSWVFPCPPRGFALSSSDLVPGSESLSPFP